MSSFEDDMKDALEGAEFAPSDKVWTGIASAIAPKKKKGILFMWQTYGIAAGIILATTFGFLMNDGFFYSEDSITTKQLSEEAKGNKIEKDDNVLADTLGATKAKSGNLEENTVASIDKQHEQKDLIDRNALKDSPTVVNDLPLKLQVQNTGVTNKKDAIQIKLETIDLALNTHVVNAKNANEIRNADILKSNTEYNGEASKASELLLDSKLNLALKSSTQAANAEVSVTQPASTDTDPVKPTITADLSTASETAMRIQNATSPIRERSVSGSLGNNVLNISSGLGSANSTVDSNLRDPNTFNSLDATVDNTEGEAISAISAGFGASFDVGKRLSLNVSLRYSEFKFRNTSNAYSVEDGISLPVYAPVGYNPENVFFAGNYNVENTIQSIFLQTGVGYKVATLGKFDFSLQAGVGLDYFLAYKVKGDLNFLETRKINPGESDFLSRTNLSGISGLGVNYRFNPKFGLSFDFTYRKFISGGDNDSSQPSSVIGFGLSVNYILGKKEE